MVNAAGGIVIAIIVILIVAGAGWVIFTQLRARRLGLPPPPLSSYIPFMKSNNSPFEARPARGGVVGWFNDRVRDFKHRNNRTARGAYEPSGGPARSGFDTDDAWDSRVHDDYGYYEEAELGNTSYRGGAANTTAPSGGNRLGDDLGDSGYEMNIPRTPAVRTPVPAEERRGRQPAERNPFDDDAEPSNISVRRMSPRPIDTGAGKAGKKDDDSPTDNRRSVFREDV